VVGSAYPEMASIPTESLATRIGDKSDASTKAMFTPYKVRAKKQWIGKVYEEDWEEGKPPDFENLSEWNRPRVSDTQKVGNEFVKLYKMIYATKELTEQGRQEQHRLLNVMSKKQILKMSMQAMDEKDSHRARGLRSNAATPHTQAGGPEQDPKCGV
jgi:hypothetical protein